MKVAQALKKEFPFLAIDAENYPPTPLNAGLAQALNLLFWILIISYFVGPQRMFPAAIADWYQQNSSILMMAGVFCMFASGKLMQTGAFEVLVDDQVIFSKLETGRLPVFPELVKGVSQIVGRMPQSLR